MNPKIRVTLGRGKQGILLEKLGKIAEDTVKFLQDLGQDLGIPSPEQWIADNFSSAHSVVFDLSPKADSDLWKRGLRSVMARDFSDDVMNVRISQRTRQEYVAIANNVDPDETIQFALLDGAPEAAEVYELDRSAITQFASEKPDRYRYPGEIQGIVHSFVKEVKRPKLVMRELSTRQLVDCYFTKDMYQGAVELLHDENAVISVEGIVVEDSSTGLVTEMEVTEFTPAPNFDLQSFERMIGAFPRALTGGKDSAALLDEFRDNEQ
jgi:hypothetical protein